MDAPPGVACMDTRHPRRLLAPEQVLMRFSIIYDRPSDSFLRWLYLQVQAAQSSLRGSQGYDGTYRSDGLLYDPHGCRHLQVRKPMDTSSMNLHRFRVGASTWKEDRGVGTSASTPGKASSL